MLSRIKPIKIIFYGKPFDEMKGDIIEVDYAQTNNLSKGYYIKKIYGCVVKGGGEFKNIPPKLPQKDSNGRKIEYREFDVNSKISGKPRDRERFVRGSDGRTYYSDDHYETFTEII